MEVIKKCSFKSYDRVEVKMTSIHDLFEAETCKQIMELVHPNQCHDNAYWIAGKLWREGCVYCEGYLNGSLAHSFNCIDGKYFDATAEKYFDEPYDHYQLIRVFTFQEISDVFRTVRASFFTPKGWGRLGRFYVLKDDGELIKM